MTVKRSAVEKKGSIV